MLNGLTSGNGLVGMFFCTLNRYLDVIRCAVYKSSHFTDVCGFLVVVYELNMDDERGAYAREVIVVLEVNEVLAVVLVGLNMYYFFAPLVLF